MDTIEVSNLNRQFLFRQKHVGQSKAKVKKSFQFFPSFHFHSDFESLITYSQNIYQVAREAVLKFRPHIKITPYHANVKDPEFNVDFFKQFNVVLNGLDNLDARRHVNRLCLASGVPLVESGTTGFLGQVKLSFSVLFDGDQATNFIWHTSVSHLYCKSVYFLTS